VFLVTALVPQFVSPFDILLHCETLTFIDVVRLGMCALPRCQSMLTVMPVFLIKVFTPSVFHCLPRIMHKYVTT